MPWKGSSDTAKGWAFGIALIMLTGFALAVSHLAHAQGHPAHAGPEWDHEDLEHRYVRITDAGLTPKTSRLDPKKAVGWLNYSSLVARVSFPADVVTKMTCISNGGFRVVGERLESPDIQSTQFASLCRLEPGTYSYEVTLAPGIGNTTRPPQSFEGRLVVE